MSLAQSVAAALERRSRLLIFDNCEHVLNATADMVEAILVASHAVKILATSREGLRLQDEQLWPVPSLDINSSATTLFVERASAVAPAVSLARDKDTVTEICRRLDGIPLAIELAASRLLSMTVTEIRDLLDDRLRFLIGSRRGLERHQTLRVGVMTQSGTPTPPWQSSNPATSTQSHMKARRGSAACTCLRAGPSDSSKCAATWFRGIHVLTRSPVPAWHWR